MNLIVLLLLSNLFILLIIKSVGPKQDLALQGQTLLQNSTLTTVFLEKLKFDFCKAKIFS